MEALFNTYFLAHYSLVVPAVVNIYQTTTDRYFEVEDSSARDLIIRSIRNTGVAKISNPNGALFELVNYDKFLTSLPEAFQNGRKRCDMIFRCESEGVFALGELKDSQNASNHRSKAQKQLLQSLQAIDPVPQISMEYARSARRICCYFNKSNPAPAPLSATIAFGRLSFLFISGVKQSFPAVEALGFEYYEFDGNQFLTI